MASSNESPWPQRSVLDEDLIQTGKVKVEFPEGINGSPHITIDKSVLDVLAKAWENSLIITVLGKTVSYHVLQRKIKELWNPSGTKKIHIVDIPNNHFIVRFESQVDLFSALTVGSWSIFGHYLVVRKWDPEFDPLTDEITSTYAWIRISGLPIVMYDKEVLLAIASGIGKPLKVDEKATMSRRFARVCVELDLLRPLKDGIFVNDKRLAVEYEGNVICCNCRRYGHLTNRCPLQR